MASTKQPGQIREEVSERLLTITLDNPASRNAIDPDMRDRLCATIDRAARSDEIDGVVICGAGGTFCSGANLGSFGELHDARAYRHVSHQMTALLDAIERLEKPVIAAIDGAATGVGLTLALCCDWRIAGPRARLLFREGRLGLVPTHGGVSRLVKLVGIAKAVEAVLGGDDLDAERAYELGLVSEVIDGDVVAAARVRARRMLSRAPLSFGAAKRLLHLAGDVDVQSGILAESLAQSTLLASTDHREGLAAAREHRDPYFTGR